MIMKILVYIYCVLNLFCNSNNINKESYYEDFDFVNLEGVKKVNKSNLDKLLQVIKEKDKIILKAISTELVSYSFDIVFLKKGNYYVNNSEYKVEDPNEYVKEIFYLKDGIGMKYFLSFYNNKPNYCKVSEINFIKNEISIAVFNEKHIKPSPNMTFNELKKNKEITSIFKINLYEENNKIKKVWNEYNFLTKEYYNVVSYYEGYPDSKINQFHNLYKNYLGGEIR